MLRLNNNNNVCERCRPASRPARAGGEWEFTRGPARDRGRKVVPVALRGGLCSARKDTIPRGRGRSLWLCVAPGAAMSQAASLRVWPSLCVHLSPSTPAPTLLRQECPGAGPSALQPSAVLSTRSSEDRACSGLGESGPLRVALGFLLVHRRLARLHLPRHLLLTVQEAAEVVSPRGFHAVPWRC